MAVPSSSSSFTYDVFLSFRGEDTRYGFTGNLYKVLHDSGIHTFIDDEELQKGDEITTALEKAIEESIIFIVVLSQNYASSSFCLNELTASSSAVREGFELNVEKLKKWKMALREAANLSGYHFKQGWTRVKLLLDVGSRDGVHMVGIHGLGGIGEICHSLESFPEILGKMEIITELVLEASAIKELPFSFQNLIRLQILQLRCCGMFRLPSSFVMMPRLAKIIAWELKGWLFPEQVEGEERKLHEAGNTMFWLSGAMFPEWFDRHSQGPSNCFWFRNKFPAIALCIAIGPRPIHYKHIEIVGPIVIINGIECLLDPENDSYLWLDTDHTCLFDLQKTDFADKLNKEVLENEWNHVEITYSVEQRFHEKEKHLEIPVFIESVIYVFK
ncbi:TMV resistance protein N [Glycine max]|uniref:TMV resistance protein N n=1 Tax=Glycine soja TaxID=3848 RepID=A0A445J0K7_GLYSO|nr:TMV resistance protein N [Glycine max]RZB91906.1 TMV resistance protein N [Glycine soja]